MARQKNRSVLLICLVAGTALILGVFVSQYLSSRAMDQFHGTVLNQPRTIQSFTLEGIDHKPFTNANLKGHWTLVFFGFTSCGAICPTTMAQLGEMYRLLEKQEVKPMPQVVMISVDPERDTLDKLSHYVKAFDPHFYGAVGNEASTQKMTKEMGIAYAKVALPDTKNLEQYDIEHTGTILVFNPKGELNAFFTMPHQASMLASDYQLLVNHY